MSETALKHHLDDLKAQRATLDAQLVRLAQGRAKLTAAERAESEALAAIGALGQAEVAAVKAWASSGSAGAPPTTDRAERERLTRALGFAQAEAEAARGAAAGIDAEIGDVHRQMTAVAAMIEEAAIEVVAAAFQAKWAELLADVGELRSRAAEACGGLLLIRSVAEQHRMASRDDQARRVFSKAETMANAAPMPDFQPTSAEVTAAYPAWIDRFAELLQ